MILSVIMKIVKNSESRQLAMKECEEKVCRKKNAEQRIANLRLNYVFFT